LHSSKIFEGKEPSKYKLIKIFVNHSEKFDEDYKKKLFEFGVGELQQEAMEKYDKVSG
jgi:hypothetical protein